MACKLSDPSTTDDTALDITVTPGAAVATVATIEPTTTTAGEAATVTCEATYEFGNVTDDAATIGTDPAEGAALGEAILEYLPPRHHGSPPHDAGHALRRQGRRQTGDASNDHP